MDDVTRKTIKTIETLETIKHNETVERKEIVQEQSFYLSSVNVSADNRQRMLKSLNKDGSKHALGIRVNNDDEEKALASDLLHVNDSAIVQEEPLAKEAGHVHSAHFYLALLHQNGSTLHNNSRPSMPSLQKNGEPAGGNESVKLAGRMTERQSRAKGCNNSSRGKLNTTTHTGGRRDQGLVQLGKTGCMWMHKSFA